MAAKTYQPVCDLYSAITATIKTFIGWYKTYHIA